MRAWLVDGTARREADLAIRLSRPEAGDLTAVKIDEMHIRLYAAAAYLADTPEAHRRFIGSEGPMIGSPQEAALARAAAGRGFGFRSDHAEIQLALAIASAGIAMLPDFMAAERRDLVAVSPEDAPVVRQVWLVFHSDMRNAAPIRAVVADLRPGGVAVDQSGRSQH